MLLLIDNYDSFTWNVAQYFNQLGQEVEVVRNDRISVAQIAARAPTALILSPGPCTPDQAGICLEAIRALQGRIPIFGICLGLQCMAQALGGKVVRAPTVMHGKLSWVRHQAVGVFQGLPQPLKVARYHSLSVEPETLPQEQLEVTAWSEDDGSIMALRHRSLALEGVQFHPESLFSASGHRLLANFLTEQGIAVDPAALQELEADHLLNSPVE